MKILSNENPRNRGYLLNVAFILSFVMAFSGGAIIWSGSQGMFSEYQRWDSSQAYYHAENAVSWAAQKIADGSTGGRSAPFIGKYQISGDSVDLPYLQELFSQELIKDVWVTIGNHPNNVNNLYLVTSSAKVGSKTRTVQATIRKNPPSQIFDYEYFLNNWGWWWGRTITGFGDNRTNWDFDFRFNPSVNGNVISNGNIESDGVPVDPFGGTLPFTGVASTDPLAFIHSGSPRLQMPNLMNFSKYEDKARAAGGRVSIGGNVVINAVHPNGVRNGIYLQGTAADPIVFNGPVVVHGDVVIQGPITGIGTLYVGGNLYVANSITYSNGPDFSTPPTSAGLAYQDNWVKDAIDQRRDLVAFAVRESIYGGDVNSIEWKGLLYDAPSYGLGATNIVTGVIKGDESQLGENGIDEDGTGDDGVPYLDMDGDGVPDSSWYDADGDGFGRNLNEESYNYNGRIRVTNARADRISNYPTDPVNPGQLQAFSSVASNNFNRIDGVFYTNHATAVRLRRNNTVWNGAVITRDEIIYYNRSWKMIYDPRIHSRYSNDPNRYIDLGLPIANQVRSELFEEIAPIEGNVEVY